MMKVIRYYKAAAVVMSVLSFLLALRGPRLRRQRTIKLLRKLLKRLA
ncbi:hypothetical protein [Effusibacillus dendaii]|nr:hypothetical protein [Effusibacillus dendaii]